MFKENIYLLRKMTTELGKYNKKANKACKHDWPTS